MKNLCLGVLILLAACGPESGNIRGRIEGLTCDTLLVEYVTARDMMANERTRGHDTLIAHNGRFEGNIAVEEPTLFTLSPLQLAAVRKPGYSYIRPEAQVNFMLDRDEKVRIDVKIEEGYVVTRMRGTQSNRDLAELFNRWNPISREEALYSERIRSGEIARDSVSRETLRGYKDRMSQVFVDFVRANPDSPIVGIVFSNVPEGQVEECGALLGEAARSSLFAPLIERKESQAEYRRVWTAAKERIRVGAEAPDFALAGADGNEVSLSALRGKYVVLDFLGSWCGACLDAFPKMKEYYSRYAGRYEVVGIACNDGEQAWRKAMERYALPWLNVYVPAGTPPSASLATLYAIGVYPTQVLINPQGRIELIGVGSENPAIYEKLDSLFR